MLRIGGRRYNLWCSGKGDENGGVGHIVKEELSEKMVKVKRVNIVMAFALFVKRASRDRYVATLCCGN